MALTYSYDLSTAVGQVRFHIGDAPDSTPVNPLTGPRDTWPCVLADEEIAYALGHRGNVVLEAAADCLLSIASDRAKLEASLRVGDYSRDPKGQAAALRAQAAALREQAQAQPAEAVIWEIATDFQAREQLVRDALDQVEGW